MLTQYIEKLLPNEHTQLYVENESKTILSEITITSKGNNKYFVYLENECNINGLSFTNVMYTGKTIQKGKDTYYLWEVTISNFLKKLSKAIGTDSNFSLKEENDNG